MGKKKKYTFNDLQNGDVTFTNEKERIRYMSNAYKEDSINDVFAKYYNIKIDSKNLKVVDFSELELGHCYVGEVKEISKHGIMFDFPGIKDEIICKENFNGCVNHIQNYLLTHDNKLVFEVRAHEQGKWIVSILNAMYKLWKNAIDDAIYTKKAINVHIDSLTKGGYLCHTIISTLKDLTGRDYTHSVFIPGSAIVLNIENDFEKWIDEDVLVIPQKFMEFRKNLREGVVENSLVASRKALLQLQGVINLYEIYNKYLLTQSDNFKSDPEILHGHVTGIINSGKKTGVFVELDGLYITGLMPVDQMNLINYKPGDSINVYASQFEVKEGVEPFVTNKKGDILKCNTRVVFAEAV